MDVTSYEELIKSEESARKYLLRFCWKNHQRFCPRCKTRKLYRLGSGRRRCSRCGYTFHDFSLRFINNGALTCRQWLWLIKLFELETPTAVIAGQMRLTYNTAYKALTNLREAILAHALDASEIQALFSGGRPPAPGRQPVFGAVERGGWVFLDLVPDLTSETVLHFKLNFHLKTASLGNLVYTDPYRHYDTLVFCQDDFIDERCLRHRDKGLAVDADKERGAFWTFAKERFKRFKGITPQRFPLYAKELEFRYNHRNRDLFATLASHLCALTPTPLVSNHG